MQKPVNFPEQPSHIWNKFFEITQIPRPSKKEEKFRDFLVSTAASKKLEYKVDSVGNVVIYVPGTEGKEDSPAVIIQNHMDMVTDAVPERNINFETDPIITYIKDGWIWADGTTLGADNGIGCAAALAIIEDSSAIHPPLELLFTVDEETGLNGANGLDGSLLKGRKMLNLDTEEWGSFYIGCAGGIDYDLVSTMKMNDPVSSKVPVKITVGELCGGHSGCDIHMQLANSIKLLGEVLYEIQGIEIELSQLNGGKAHNIIPRDSSAIVYIEKSKLDELNQELSRIKSRWLTHFAKSDLNVALTAEIVDGFSSKVISSEDFKRIVNFFNVFPHGAHLYNLEIEDLVSLSNNLAICTIDDGKFFAKTSVRFLDREEAVSFEFKLKAVADLCGMNIEKLSEYPSWKPDFTSDLLQNVREEYKKLYGEEAKIKAIHAGLECGILIEKLGKTEAVSFGPTIKGAHSPSERMDVESVAKFWELFKGLLAVM